jgi:hypothetical protein
VRNLRVCVCVCVCARARAPAHVHMWMSHTLTHSFSHIGVCVCASLVDDILYCKPAPFSVWCVNLAVLGTVGGGLASSAHEWLLKRLAAVIAQRGVS